MDEFFSWNDALILGIEGMDEEHEACAKLLHAIFQILLKRGENGEGAREAEEVKELQALFRRLYETISDHFVKEEAMMRKVGYPAYDEHLREHNLLRAELLHHEDVLLHHEQGLDIKVLLALKNWFVVHITLVDRDFAEYLKAQIHDDCHKQTSHF